MEIKTPLRYPGGKSRVADWLVSLFPTFDEYREPFVGGGSVFIETKQTFKIRKYWINDLYYDLYCFWDVLKHNYKSVENLVKSWKEEHKDGRELYSFIISKLSNFETSKTERAAAFFIVNRISFSGTSMSGGFSQEAFEKRFTDSSIDRMVDIPQLLDAVKITNLDYSELLSNNGNNVFVFLDPPYYTATKSALYGKNGELHKGFNHERFADDIKKCRHKWMITYDNSDYIKELYKDYQITPFEFMYGMCNTTKNKGKTGKEILITNYDVPINSLW